MLKKNIVKKIFKKIIKKIIIKIFFSRHKFSVVVVVETYNNGKPHNSRTKANCRKKEY